MQRLVALLLALVLAMPATAQEAALLVADKVYLIGSTKLIAEGNVEALQNGSRITASKVIYDRESDTITLEGPVRILDPQGNLITADGAELDTSLRNGLLRGARMVLDEQLQIASVEARRVDGRYTQLSKVAVTSCQVCANQTPLWQIRASRVVHDAEERQLYFDNAQLRILDVPVFYLPRLRLPDPTLERARGFLTPVGRSSTRLGFGVKVPYFIPIGPHQDITFTPYISPVTRTLETRYRRAFRYGDLQIDAALSNDSLTADTWRGYLFAEGTFDLRRDFTLQFDIETTTDEAYLADYGYSDKDRLDSALSVSRTRKDQYISAGVIHYESLRDGENNATQPTLITETTVEQRFFPRATGGELRLGASSHSHYRYSNVDVLGRDVSGLNAEASWRRRWTLPGGLRLGLTGQLWADAFHVDQDSTADSSLAQLTPAAAVELRWPLVNHQGGSHHLLEPVAQVGWVGGTRPNLPNDESTRVEFDEANLLTLSRFPEDDARERGLAKATGLRWVWMAQGGWESTLTVGKVWRDTADPRLTRTSGLSGTESHTLIAGGLRTANGVELLARGLLESPSYFSKAEARAAWSNAYMDLAASFILLRPDAAENRPATQSEWSFDGAYKFNSNWTGSANWRYDLADNRMARAGLGLDYANECISVGFSVSRRFATSTNLEPSTDYGLTVALTGFSTGGPVRADRRQCGP